MLLRFGFTTWAIAKKRFTGFIPLSIEVGSLECFWIIGSPGFELLQAQNAFFQLVGPYINGYAFGDTDGLVKVAERVQQEGRKIPDLQTSYPNIAFRSKSEWESANTDLADGMSKLISTLKEMKDDIRRQRIQQGIEEKFSKLTNKELAGR